MRNLGRLIAGVGLFIALVAGIPRAAAADASAGAGSRRLGLGLGASLGAFHSCPSFSLTAAFPLTARLSAEGEFTYHFNPAGTEKDPPPGAHRSSAGLGLTFAGILSLGGRGGLLTPYGGLGAGFIYLSTLDERPPEPREIHARNRFSASVLGGLRAKLGAGSGLNFEARWVFLSGGEGRFLRLAAGAFVVF